MIAEQNSHNYANGNPDSNVRKPTLLPSCSRKDMNHMREQLAD